MLRHVPNIITIARMAGCLPLSVLIVREQHLAALWLAVVIAFSDVLDGLLARKFGWQSRIGGLLDPVADKLFLLCAFVSLGVLGAVPLWLIALVVMRDLVIVAGALAYHRLVEPVPAEPSWFGKLSTVSQVLLVLTVMVQLAGYPVPGHASDVLVVVVALLAVVSGAHYVWTWSARARAAWKTREWQS